LVDSIFDTGADIVTFRRISLLDFQGCNSSHRFFAEEPPACINYGKVSTQHVELKYM